MKIVKELGEGGFGKAILVENKKGELYVVKIPKGEEGQEQARREANVLRHIKKHCNPYLVCVENIQFRNHKVRGIMIQYIPGTFELFSYLQNNHITPAMKMLIVKRLVEGLYALHSMGVVHRDIKPDNVLIDPETLNTRYIDYGSSCLKFNIQCQREPAGTIIYMSPELIYGDLTRVRKPWKMCRATDIWALGAMIMDVFFLDQSQMLMDSEFWLLPQKRGERADSRQRIIKTIAVSSPEWIRRRIFKDVVQCPVNEVFCDLVTYILQNDWEDRPSAKDILGYINGPMTMKFLRLYSIDDVPDDDYPKALEEVAHKYALEARISENTRIFPNFFGTGNRKTI
uniref:Protein kinase domain-containing protein n=1 Tax=viral metagenome TaxID=1070528 RepID=A0A6C0ELU2_9ZZZZ